MSHNCMAIAATEARDAAEKEDNLTDRLKAAIRVTKGHWLVTNEVQQLNAAVAAVMEISSAEERERLGIEMRILNAYARGSFAEIMNLAMDAGHDYQPIGLRDLWNCTRTEQQDQELARLREEREKLDAQIKKLETGE